ncbi:MAG: hypothetical protein ACKOES_11375, partial [Planctomycetaceae bacterium]
MSAAARAWILGFAALVASTVVSGPRADDIALPPADTQADAEEAAIGLELPTDSAPPAVAPDEPDAEATETASSPVAPEPSEPESIEPT